MNFLFFLFILAIAGLAMYGCFDSAYSKRETKLEDEARALKQQTDAVKAHKVALDKWQAAEMQRLEQQDAEYARKLAAIHAAQVMLVRNEVPDTSHAGVSAYLRSAFRQGVLVGEYIRVMYLLSTDGFLTLRWEVDWPATSDPMVEIYRGATAVRSDWGRKGEHNDQVDPGRYQYRFNVTDPRVANRAKNNSLLVEIVVPEPDVWDSQPPGTKAIERKMKPGQQERALLKNKVGAFVATEKAAAKLRQEVEKVLRKQAVPEDEFENQMARLDGRIAEIREEIGA